MPLTSQVAQSHKPEMSSKPDVTTTALPKTDLSARSKLLGGLLPSSADPTKPKAAESLAKSAESLPKVASPIQATVTVNQPVAVETVTKTPAVDQPKPVLPVSKVSL